MIRMCSDCPEAISDKRLKAVPHAIRCIQCETKKGTVVIHEPRTNMARLGFMQGSNDGSMSPRKRFNLVTRGLASVINAAA